MMRMEWSGDIRRAHPCKLPILPPSSDLLERKRKVGFWIFNPAGEVSVSPTVRCRRKRCRKEAGPQTAASLGQGPAQPSANHSRPSSSGLYCANTAAQSSDPTRNNAVQNPPAGPWDLGFGRGSRRPAPTSQARPLLLPEPRGQGM